MAHGDDAGLRLPPQLAPVQVVLAAIKDAPGVAASPRSVRGLPAGSTSASHGPAQRAQARREASDYAAETFELSEAKEFVRTAARFVTAIEALVG